MSGNLGVWVDHRRAVVVKLHDGSEEILSVESEVERQLRRSGDRTDGAYEPLAVPADDVQGRKFQAGLNAYYDEVITFLKEASEILILGPGEAPGELRKRIEGSLRPDVRVEVQKADRMTDAQVAATVRKHFQNR